MLTDFFSDLIGETVETIGLETDQMDTALNLSQQADSDQGWSIYLKTLAQFGFQNWLQKREPDLTIRHPRQPLDQPTLDGICQLQVGEFKVCLIPSNGLSQPDIIIPRAVIDLPEYAAHFYVSVGVVEDLELTSILSFLRYDQLVGYQPNLEPLIDWTYAVPREWFNRDTDELLLNLHCLAPTAIPLPAIPSSRPAELAAVGEELVTLLPQGINRPLWQVLNWQQGKAFLTQSALLEWFKQPQQSLVDLLQAFTQPTINLGQWLHNQLDEVSQGLSWQLLPLPTMRGFLKTVSPTSPDTELQDILNELEDQYQIQVPPEAICGWNPISNQVKLYAIAGLTTPEEWTLLLIAVTPPEAIHPPQLQWCIRDQTQVLIDNRLRPELGQTYLFTQLIGDIGEKFFMTLTLENNQEVTHIFEFQPNRNQSHTSQIEFE